MIHIQHPKPDPIKVLRDELKEEERFEEVAKMPSFRADLLRKLIKKIEKLNTKWQS